MAEEISFQGFGPITQSAPTFQGGFGRSSSYVPQFPKKVNIDGNSLNTRQIFYPFQVLRKYIDGTLSYGVAYYSELRASFLDSNSQFAIQGLLSQNYPTDTDSGWVNANTGDRIYLEIEFNEYGGLSTAKIKMDTNYVGGIDVTGGDVEFTDADPPKLQYSRKLIAEINDDGTVLQYCYNNLGMMNICVNGYGVAYPVIF
jgi:hypothetical protein